MSEANVNLQAEEETEVTFYCGIDLHANNCVLVVLDETDGVLLKQRFANDPWTILDALEPYRRELPGIAVESTFN